MTTEKIIQAIQDYDRIIIHRHVRPDPDALGSQAGLGQIIKETYPEKQVYLVGEEDPSLQFLAKMDDIPDTYYEDALVIVCDTANQERISDGRYTLGKQLIKIDHHPNVDTYGDSMLVDTSASSTSEIIYELYLHAKEAGFQMNDEAARALYAGIIGDTGRFLFPSTSRKTFEYAADLVTYNFDRPTLHNEIYSVKANIARLRGYILQNFELSSSGMCSIHLTKETLEKFGVDPIDSGQLVGVLGDIEGITAWVFFIEEKDIIRVRLRSKGPVINEIAAHYNGGGHPLAAGASVNTWEEAKQVVRDLDKVCNGYVKK
ncbi:DHH family phosphoesterase [Oceanobacillus halotolerans]|uniref:DHH family phosphoesterase n=1 Tax=Oceanobacillus halotolerans TaxID=2663380 RepID=UPI0013DC9DA2|nr:bifunctional oligoribonuclease/PAP phosphatase NrnA [Oceanobacillus halotolerans]